MATKNFCYIKGGNRDQALRMMDNVKLFMSRKEQAFSDDQRFIKLKNIVNAVIEQFNPQSTQSRNHVQERNRRFSRN